MHNLSYDVGSGSEGQFKNMCPGQCRRYDTLIQLHVCAGWSVPLLVAHTILLEISFRGLYVFVEKCV